MRPRPLGAGFVRLFQSAVAVLAVTGLAQMPIFKRYYVADLPGWAGWPTTPDPQAALRGRGPVLGSAGPRGHAVPAGRPARLAADPLRRAARGPAGRSGPHRRPAGAQEPARRAFRTVCGHGLDWLHLGLVLLWGWRPCAPWFRAVRP